MKLLGQRIRIFLRPLVFIATFLSEGLTSDSECSQLGERYSSRTGILLYYFLKNICVYIYFNLLILEREEGRGERERETSICSTYLYIHWLILVVPWPGIEPATLVYQDNTVTDWTLFYWTLPSQGSVLLLLFTRPCLASVRCCLLYTSDAADEVCRV